MHASVLPHSARPTIDPILLLAGQTPLRDALERELRILRAPVVCARSGEEGIEKLAALSTPPSVVILPESAIRTDVCEAELAELRVRTRSSRLIPIAVGTAPDQERRRALRDAGIHLALFAPFGRHALRFQINRALAERSHRQLRGERRAPQEWRTQTWASGREKAVRCYSLSTRGAYLVAPRPWVVGSEIEFDLHLGDRAMRVDAHVLYTNADGPNDRPTLPRGMAVEFEPLPIEIQDAIRHDIARRQSGLEI